MAFKYTKRADGRLMKRVSVNGNLITLYSDNPKDLEKQYIEKKNQDHKGIFISDEGMTVGVWADKWVDLYKKDKAQATINMYKDTIRLYIKPNLGNIKLKNLKQSDIVDMLNKLDEKGITRRKEYSLITLKQILQTAVDNDYMYKNVATGVKLQRHKSNEKKPLNDDVINRIKKLSSNDFDMFMILFMIYTGLRRGEVVPLQYKDIDLDNQLLTVDKAVHFSNNQPIIKRTKTEYARTVPILNIIYNKLKLLKSIHKSTDYIFTNSLGKMMTETSLKRKLKHVLNVLNMDLEKEKKDSDTLDTHDNSNVEKIQFTYHQLRHTYACILHKAGIGLKEAQKWTGHKNVQVLLDIYTHLDEQDNKKAVDKINQFLS